MTARSRKPPVGKRSRSGSGAVRIVGGRWRRRTIPVVDVDGLRPTPDRVRETVFNWIVHAFGGLEGCVVLDLFAGSGALGFEAASRGAERAVLVEHDAVAARHLAAVKETLGAENVQIETSDAFAAAERMAGLPLRFDVVFLDPPFGTALLDRALPIAAGLIGRDGLLYVETGHPLHDERLTALGLAAYRSDKAGEVIYYLLQRKKED